MSHKDSVQERLRKRLKGYYGQDEGKDRVENPAIPFDSLMVFDFPGELEYDWVPAPGGLAPQMHNVADMANRRSFYIQRGWQYYPAEEMAHEPGTGLPWMNEFEDDGGKVRAQDHWLVYADREIEQRKRQENVDRFNQKREGVRATIREEAEGDSKGVRTFVESERGQASVLDILREESED